MKSSGPSACGTGGFLLSAHSYVATHYKLEKDQKRHLRYDALRGVELVDGVARLCAMNLFSPRIGPDDGKKKPPVKTDDALRNAPSELVEVVLTNPPFGRRSSITVINEEGETDKEFISYSRPRLLDHDVEQAVELRPAREVDAQDPRSGGVVVPDKRCSRAALARRFAGSCE